MRLQLHRASADNLGRFVDAGVVIGVGDADDQVAESVALELLDSSGAVDLDAAEVLDLKSEQFDHERSAEQ